MALTNLVTGSPWLIQKFGIEHRVARVKRLWQKRATPARPSPTPAESPSGLTDNLVGGECFATWKKNNRQGICKRIDVAHENA